MAVFGSPAVDGGLCAEPAVDRVVAPRREARRVRRAVVHVEHGEVGAEPARDVGGDAQRSARLLREVDGTADLLPGDLFHRVRSPQPAERRPA